MTIDPELSRQLIACLSVRANPASISKAIDFILSVYLDRDAAHLLFHILCVDDTGRVVPHEKRACRPRLSRRTGSLCNW